MLQTSPANLAYVANIALVLYFAVIQQQNTYSICKVGSVVCNKELLPLIMSFIFQTDVFGIINVFMRNVFGLNFSVININENYFRCINVDNDLLFF